MSDLLIKNMEIPKDGSELVIKITRHGQVAQLFASEDGKQSFLIRREAKATEIPPHGRAIEADTLKTQLAKYNYPEERGWYFAEACQFIDEAPTVLEASE